MNENAPERTLRRKRMGTFSVDTQLASPHALDRREAIKLLVDTGSAYTWVSAALLHRLGIQPFTRRRIVTIDGSVSEREMAEVVMTLEGETLHTLCLVGREGDLEVLGAYTLEGFGLGVDPVHRRLIPAIMFGALASARSVAV